MTFMIDVIDTKRIGSNVWVLSGRKPKFKMDMGGPSDVSRDRLYGKRCEYQHDSLMEKQVALC